MGAPRTNSAPWAEKRKGRRMSADQISASGSVPAPDAADTRDTHVSRFEPLVSPAQVLAEMPLSAAVQRTVMAARAEIRDALEGRDSRLVIIAGPCSIHDAASAIEYATRLSTLRRELKDRFIILMRTYFEKPRTTVGWKGLIYDPARDESHDMNRGLRDARRILLDINGMGLPCATEFLDPIVPQYTADLVSWAAIGARTTESQTHRQMASGLSMPVGFKNATDGSLQGALDAMHAATHAQSFLGIDPDGKTSIVRTRGNPDVHVILRGGNRGSNYSRAHIASVMSSLGEQNSVRRPVLVDCSHGNSAKDYRRQPGVFQDVIGQVGSGAGSGGLLGVMLESHLVEGRQEMTDQLVFGQSITDSCIGWEETDALVRKGHADLAMAPDPGARFRSGRRQPPCER
jgi:3-deoxy-7-phosphoheptulonate synthase